MTKPVYKHPDFVTEPKDCRIEKENKRLWLSLTIDENLSDSLIVVLKNPSRATKDISDKTVYTVTNYIYKNKNKYPQLKNIGTIVILNLIPFYQTYAELLAASSLNIIDEENMRTIAELTSKHKNVIVAWGNHPKGLYKEYEQLKKKTLKTLKVNKNNIYYVDRLTKIGNPKHGQVWGYDNELFEFTLPDPL